MPGARVFFEGIHRRQVKPATKPPGFALARSEQANIRMRRRRVGIQRVHDAARAHGAKRLASQLCMALTRRRRKARAAHVAESDAGAIESRSILDERQAARTAEHIARRPLPFVTALLARLI